MRRRGYTPEAIRAFCERVGVSTRDSVVDVTLLEHALREDLNARSPRVMAVLRPLKVVLENFPEGEVDRVRRALRSREAGRAVAQGAPLARALHRARGLRGGPAEEVVPPRARGRRCASATRASLRCTSVVKDAQGEVVELRCTWDPEFARRRAAGRAQGEGDAPLGRRGPRRARPRCASTTGSSRWRIPLKDKDVDFKTHLNPKSLETLRGCQVEPSLAGGEAGSIASSSSGSATSASTRTTKPGALVFNRTITLRDSWAAIAGKGEA